MDLLFFDVLSYLSGSYFWKFPDFAQKVTKSMIQCSPPVLYSKSSIYVSRFQIQQAFSATDNLLFFLSLTHTFHSEAQIILPKSIQKSCSLSPSNSLYALSTFSLFCTGLAFLVWRRLFTALSYYFWAIFCVLYNILFRSSARFS